MSRAGNVSFQRGKTTKGTEVIGAPDVGNVATTSAPRAQVPSSRARAVGDNVPGNAERDRLVATLGATLRSLRAEYGMSTQQLARRSATSRSTITRLERGERRPRRSLLSSLALGLDPDEHLLILDVLVRAAGRSVRAETGYSRRRRRRLMEAGILAGEVPLPSHLARRMALHQRADAAAREADRILASPGALADTAALRRADALMAEASAVRRQAGPPFTLRIGGQVIRVGYGS